MNAMYKFAHIALLVASCGQSKPIEIEYDEPIGLTMQCAGSIIEQKKGHNLYTSYAEQSYEYVTGHSILNGRKSVIRNVFSWHSKKSKQKFVFVGTGGIDGPPWWFGKMNGMDVVGYSMNRFNVRFGNRDSSFALNCWADGWKSGSY
jgi:hypothetical protein